MSNPVGRPEEYTPERIAKITEQLNQYIATEPLPFWCDFCYKHNVNHRLSKTLQGKSEEFRETFARLEAKEESVLLKGGLSGKFNASTTALVLKNHRDYREKEDVSGRMDHNMFFQEIIHKANERRKKRQEEEQTNG